MANNAKIVYLGGNKMLEIMEGIICVIVLIGIGVAVGICTAVYKYYNSAAKVIRKADNLMEPLTKFYTKMLNNDDDLL